MDAFAQHERARLKAVLDATSDFAIAGSRVTFAQHFETVCAKELFCVMPDSLVDSCRRLSDADICSMESSKVAPPRLCGEGMRTTTSEDVFVDRDLTINFPDINNIVKTLSEMLHVANVLREWNNFHSVAGFFACIRAYSAISWPNKTHTLLLETSLKTLDRLDKSLGLETKTTRSTGGIWRIRTTFAFLSFRRLERMRPSRSTARNGPTRQTPTERCAIDQLCVTPGPRPDGLKLHAVPGTLLQLPDCPRLRDDGWL